MDYMDYIPVPSMEGNPWADMAAQGQANVNFAGQAAQNRIPGMAFSLGQQQQSMQQYAGDTAPIPYPAHANDWGLGQQTQQAPTQDNLNRGSPWLLQGDALAR